MEYTMERIFLAFLLFMAFERVALAWLAADSAGAPRSGSILTTRLIAQPPLPFSSCYSSSSFFSTFFLGGPRNNGPFLDIK
jgi:hypothetical protein